ncbi:hypothetical protein [Streptomyces sp. NBC_00385]|uniref:hypothetical protein n=1 Tax=Streptomyces sp. NBC_00385 TaxID=2975733 RepID=UPI002DDB1379|nr:hypothetical protein [Streptomyces sp. NBC_00385]WRZ05059.1 hypothetical protein OG959_17730 [Streptomyces sp. NBC_00385]
MPDTTPTTPAPFRYVDEDDFHLSAHLVFNLPATLSITIEGSDEPQSAHVPVGDLPKVLAGIAAAAGLPPARLVLGTTDQQPTTAEAERQADIADSVTAHTKALLTRRTETLRKRAERAEAERDQLRADRAAVLREAEAKAREIVAKLWGDGTTQTQLDRAGGARAVEWELGLMASGSRLADEAQQPEPARFCGRADCLAPGHRFMLGTTVHTCTGQPEAEICGRFVPDTPRAPGLCASCGDARGWHAREAVEEQPAADQPDTETEAQR